MSLKLKSKVSLPATVINDTSVGDVEWLSPERVTAQDDLFAETELNSNTPNSNYLYCTDFNFGLPRKALIVGFKCLVVAKSESSDGVQTFEDIKLIEGGSVVGTNRAHNSQITTTLSQYEFGGARDVWGLLPDASKVAQKTFGVAVQVKTTAPISFPTISVDAVRLQIFYAHSIKQAIHARLIAQDLIKSLVGGRIYWSIAPSNVTSPYLVFSRVSSNSTQHQLGASGLAESRFQIDSCSADADEADALSTAVRMVMDGYRGTTNDTFINKIILDNEIDGIEVPSVGRQNSIARTTQDYIVWHDESIPTT